MIPTNSTMMLNTLRFGDRGINLSCLRRDGFSCLAHDSYLSNLVAGTLRGSIAIADCETGSFTRTHVLSEMNARVHSIECDGASNGFCSYGNGSIATMDARTCKVFANFQAHDDQCTRVRCLENRQSTNNFQFITSSNDGIVNVWDARKFSSRSAARVRSFHVPRNDARAHQMSSKDKITHREKGPRHMRLRCARLQKLLYRYDSKRYRGVRCGKLKCCGRHVEYNRNEEFARRR